MQPQASEPLYLHPRPAPQMKIKIKIHDLFPRSFPIRSRLQTYMHKNTKKRQRFSYHIGSIPVYIMAPNMCYHISIILIINIPHPIFPIPISNPPPSSIPYQTHVRYFINTKPNQSNQKNKR